MRMKEKFRQLLSVGQISESIKYGLIAGNKGLKRFLLKFSASSGGLFAGLLFLICALVSIGIHSIFSQHCDSHGALLVFRLSDMALFSITLIGCSIGLYRY